MHDENSAVGSIYSCNCIQVQVGALCSYIPHHQEVLFSGDLGNAGREAGHTLERTKLHPDY